MNLKAKIFLSSFIVGGTLFSLVGWAEDSVEKIPFSLQKLLIRFIIYGFCMALSFYITNLAFGKKEKKKA
jgi:hypothetical protein